MTRRVGNSPAGILDRIRTGGTRDRHLPGHAHGRHISRRAAAANRSCCGIPPTRSPSVATHRSPVQSMTTTVTADINSTLQQIAELTAAGCQVVRVAVPSADDAEALPTIAKKSNIPVVADIHFQPVRLRRHRRRLRGVRVNPATSSQFDDQVADRPGGSRRRDAHPDRGQCRIVGSATSRRSTARPPPRPSWNRRCGECSPLRRARFHHDLKISVKHHDPVVMVQAYRLSERWRLSAAPGRHRGRPGAAGDHQVGRPPSAPCCPRASATRSGCRCPHPGRRGQGRHRGILESLNLRPRGLEIVSCPSWVGPRSTFTPGRAGHRRPPGPRGAAAGRRHGLCVSERSGEARGRPWASPVATARVRSS